MFAIVLFDELRLAWERSQDTFWPQTLLFLSLTLRGLGLALLIGIPTGIALTRLARVSGPVLGFLALVQTIPSLVLLGLLIPLLGIGQQPTLFCAVVYSLFPIVMNTYIGITQVPPAIRDAARGMGMTGRQILLQVELPLAFPVLLAGVRTGAIYASAMIVIGSYIGAGGLGDYIYRGMSLGDSGLIWLGALPVLVLTLLLFWGLGGLAWLARKNSGLGMALGGGLIVVLSLYAVYGIADRMVLTRRADVVIGAKDFVEGQILAEVLKQTLQAHTDLSVEIVPNLGAGVILKSLKNGNIDVYPEYTGNLLTNKEALDMGVPADKSVITALVRAEMKRRHGLVLLDTFGLNNTYAPCLTRATSDQYKLHAISDLKRVPQLRVVFDLSFLTRPDGWEGMLKKYGLHFKNPPQQIGADLRYKVLAEGKADLVIGFSTDWEIQKFELVVLDDDYGYFPNYHGAPLVREDLLQRHPEVEAALKKLAGQISDDDMRSLNYEVAVNRRPEAEVVHEFLEKKGLLR